MARHSSPTPAGAPRTSAPAAVPPALPRGLDFFRFLILLAEASVLLAIALFLAPDFGVLLADPLGILVATGLVGAVLTIAIRRAWGILAGGLLVALFPVASLTMFMVFLLMDPLGGRDFAGALLTLFALLLALPAAIRGFRRARRAEHTPIARGWRSPHGTFVMAAAFLMLGAMYAGGLASAAAKQTLGGGADFSTSDVGGETKTLLMEGFAFKPKDLQVTQGRLTEIRIENDDAETHTFTYVRDGQEYDHVVYGDAASTVWVLFNAPGTVRFRCTPHSNGYDDPDGMVGTITVAPA